jgi:hypothetical protein
MKALNKAGLRLYEGSMKVLFYSYCILPRLVAASADTFCFKALLRLYSAAVKALLKLFQGCIKALSRLCQGSVKALLKALFCLDSSLPAQTLPYMSIKMVYMCLVLH